MNGYIRARIHPDKHMDLELYDCELYHFRNYCLVVVFMKETKIQACIKLAKDGSWLLFWVFNLRSKRKSLGPGIVLHDFFYPRVQDIKPCRSLGSRLIFWACSSTAKLRQWSLWKIESGWQCNRRGHVSATSSGRTHQLCLYGSCFRGKNTRD